MEDKDDLESVLHESDNALILSRMKISQPSLMTLNDITLQLVNVPSNLSVTLKASNVFKTVNPNSKNKRKAPFHTSIQIRSPIKAIKIVTSNFKVPFKILQSTRPEGGGVVLTLIEQGTGKSARINVDYSNMDLDSIIHNY